MSPTTRKSRSQSRRATRAGSEEPLREIRTDVAGIDVGAKEIYVAGLPLVNNRPNVRCFRTDTGALNEAADWIRSQGVASVAMESTGVY